MKKLLIVFTAVCLLFTAACSNAGTSDSAGENETSATGAGGNNPAMATYDAYLNMMGKSMEPHFDLYLKEMAAAVKLKKQVVATVNGEEVYNTDLAIYKADRKFTELSVGSTTHIDKAGNFKYNDRQMLEFKIEQMLAAQQAQKDGHSLTDSELDKLVESNLLQQDKLIPNYSERLIKACGMSRDEYKNKVAIPKIKEEMLFSNFRQDFSLSSDQSGGYEQKIAVLKKSADIKYFI